MVFSGMLLFFYEVDRANKNIENSSVQILQRLNNNLQLHIWNISIDGIQSVINLEMNDDNILAIILYDENNIYLYGEYKENDKSKALTATSLEKKLEELKKYSFIQLSGEVANNNLNIGYLYIFFSDYSIQQAIKTLLIKTISQILLLTTITVLIIYFTLKLNIINPIINLNNTVTKFSKKDFTARSSIESTDELGYLSKNFNNMADIIQNYSTNLEHLVKSRTQELETANIELKTALEKIKETQEQLIQSEKLSSLGKLVTGIAHEINTPVGVSVTAITYLEKEVKNISDLYNKNEAKKSHFDHFISTAAESCQIIAKNLNRASNLITSFKKISNDQSTEEKREFNVREYFNDIIMSLQPALKKTQVNVNINCSEKLFINSYPGAYYQIFSNLIMNSILHAFEEGSEGNIEIQVTTESDFIFIKYADDGVGIPEENISKIFDPFFTTARSKGGSGLGLNIVYNLVTQKLNGYIKCSSKTNNGTTFTLILPENTDI